MLQLNRSERLGRLLFHLHLRKLDPTRLWFFETFNGCERIVKREDERSSET